MKTTGKNWQSCLILLALMSPCLAELTGCKPLDAQEPVPDSVTGGAAPVLPPGKSPASIMAGQIFEEAVPPDLNERTSSITILPGNRLKYKRYNGISDEERQGSYTLEPGNVLRVYYAADLAQSHPIEYRIRGDGLESIADGALYLLKR